MSTSLCFSLMELAYIRSWIDNSWMAQIVLSSMIAVLSQERMISNLSSLFLSRVQLNELGSLPFFCLISHYLYERHSLTIGARVTTPRLSLFSIYGGSRQGYLILLYPTLQVSIDWALQVVIG